MIECKIDEWGIRERVWGVGECIKLVKSKGDILMSRNVLLRKGMRRKENTVKEGK